MAAVATFTVKASFPDAPWGLSFPSRSPTGVSDTLTSYCADARGNDLYVIDVNDEFYAAVLRFRA
jgi:hypothetical protein